jgi:predicted phosphodiesterase
MRVRFGVFTDLHTDFMHDSVGRVRQFLEACDREKVDFAIQLGDYCPPNGIHMEDKEAIRKLIAESKVPFYHLIGNHDVDANSKQEVLDFLGEKERHYSFDCGGVHFIVMDANFYQYDEQYFPYDCGNYRKAPTDAKVPVLPPSELSWLRKELAQTEYPSIVFSHQSLVESRSGIRNARAFRKVASSAPKKVLMAVCGHEHLDRLEKKEGIWYYCVNSISNYWAGSKFKHDTYPKEIIEKYPKLESVFPYREPLFAIMEISDGEITVKERASEFVGATPKELKFVKWGLKDPVTPKIRARKVKIK